MVWQEKKRTRPRPTPCRNTSGRAMPLLLLPASLQPHLQASPQALPPRACTPSWCRAAWALLPLESGRWLVSDAAGRRTQTLQPPTREWMYPCVGTDSWIIRQMTAVEDMGAGWMLQPPAAAPSHLHWLAHSDSDSDSDSTIPAYSCLKTPRRVDTTHRWLVKR